MVIMRIGVESEGGVQGPISFPAVSVTLDAIHSFYAPQFCEIVGTENHSPYGSMVKI